jgi:predicted glycogen debranching enzyme
MMMLNDVIEQVHLPDKHVLQLGGDPRAGLPFHRHGIDCLKQFCLESGLPVWRYEVDGIEIEKRVIMPHGQNTVFLMYRNLGKETGLRLSLRPSLQFRAHNASVNLPLDEVYVLTVAEDRYEVSINPEQPTLRFEFLARRGALTVDRIRIHEVLYRLEERLGYPARGDLWSPGYFHVDLEPERDVVLVASTESWEVLEALSPRDAMTAEHERRQRLLADGCRSLSRGTAGGGKGAVDAFSKELLFAADQFIVSPAGRTHHAARARAAGDEVRSVIAGYPWFTDWGRDTMISLEGLTLTTGRSMEAAWILRTFAHTVRDGLIPNLFPERLREGLYNTADATLWFIHAIDRYLQTTGDHAILRLLLPQVEDIVAHHLEGTRFGIGVDSVDGLVRQGDPTVALTWMDAKKDEWIVTPRRGKPVEINALWYNALCVLEGWLRAGGQKERAAEIAHHAERTRNSFAERFWYAEGGYLYDVLDGPEGNDSSFRPNQLFAISLPHPVLDESKWAGIVDQAKEKLLTPVGLRSLAAEDPNFKSTYEGDLLTRDGAYHQGTVWGWLIGPFVDAWLRVYPDRKEEARGFLEGFQEHMSEAGMGTISEIFDASPPFTPRGCVAQAWSVAEVLRCWVKTSADAPLRHEPAAAFSLEPTPPPNPVI